MSALGSEAVRAVDPTGQAREILDLPTHLRDALWRVESAAIAPQESAGLLVAGMGGSAIGGRLAAAAIGPRATRPILTSSGYSLPAWVDASWTVLCSSYSGATEETLAGYDAAAAARRLAATTGGPLAERARADRVPVIPLPGGFQPRAAVGYAMVIAMEAARLAGAAPALHEEIEAAAALAERLAPEWGPDGPEDAAPKALARALAGRIPVVYGSELTAPVAYRWKTQLNENANIAAFWNELPEAGHNEIEGWPADGLAPVLLVDHADTHERNLLRVGRMAQIIGGGAVVDALGDTRTERVVSLVLFGDLVSLYVAVLLGRDPAAVPNLTRLKETLGP